MDLDHVVLEVRNPRRSLEFYKIVLGLAPVREREFLSGRAPFPSVRINAGSVIDLFPRRMWSSTTRKNPNHVCINMSAAQITALRRRLRARRIRVVQEADHNFGARGYARSLYVRDPDGVTIEARSYRVHE
jgi:catechol 2,3-dioxygenase-like lactoylglutathione lyase family enzyme